MRNYYKEALLKQAFLGNNFTRSLLTHPEAVQASGLASSLQNFATKSQLNKALKDKLQKSHIMVAGLLGLFAGLAALGFRKDTKYIMGGQNDF